MAQKANAISSLTYHGRIIKPNGQPVTANNVVLKVQVKSPGSENCLMYEETHIKDMTNSNGIFSVEVGTGSRVGAGVDGGLALSKIFSNKSDSLGPFPNCDFGSTYTPNTVDTRKLLISFNDGSGLQTLQAQTITFVPFAIEANTVGGYSADSLLRVDGSTASAFTPANFTSLLALINGTSTAYVKSSDFTTVNSSVSGATELNVANSIVKRDASGNFTAGTITANLSGHATSATSANQIRGYSVVNTAPSAGQVLTWNNAMSQWEPQTPSSAPVSSVAGKTGVVTLNSSDISDATSANTANMIIKRDGSGNFSAGTITANLSGNATTATTAASATNFSGSLAGDVSGTQGATSVDKIKGTTVTYSSLTNGDFLKYNGTAWVNAAISSSNVSGLGSLATKSDIMNADINASAGIVDTKLATISTAGKVANSATTATSANTANTIVLRDGSGNFSAGQVAATRMVANTASATSASIEVGGQILSKVYNAGAATTFDWNNGNLQYTTASCGTFTFSNMYDGGSYTLVVKGTTSGTCSFSQTVPDSLSTGAFLFMPAILPTTGGKQTVFTFLRAGNDVYVTWITGF